MATITRDLERHHAAAMGYFGAFQVNDGQTAESDSIWAIVAGDSDITIDATAIVGTDLSGVSIAAGTTLYGRWSSVTVSGGYAIMYDLSGHIKIS